MRIIHTADWHMGQTLAGYARGHEHAFMLTNLARVVLEQQADALIVTGDIFDHQNPSGESQRLFYEGLVGLRKARPEMTIVITAGNHDAAGRLEAPHPLLSALNVHVVGSVRRSSTSIDAARHLIALKVGGEVAAHVLAVSYPTASCLPFAATAKPGANASAPDVATRDLYHELMEATRAGQDGCSLLVTGHLHVVGAVESIGLDKSERRILVGGQHAVGVDVFPESADYVALGHIHKAQNLSNRVRYCGSPLPLSASETSYNHGVTLIDFAGSAPVIEHIPLERPVAFHRIPHSGAIRLDELADHLTALDVDPSLPVHLQPFVQIWLTNETSRANYRTEIDRIAASFKVRLLDPRREATHREAYVPAQIARLADSEPRDLFARAFTQEHDFEPRVEHLRVFDTVLASALAEV